MNNGDTSSRPGVIRTSGDDAFEKRLRRKSALSANTTSVIDDSDRSGNTRQSSGSIRSTQCRASEQTSDDYQKKINAKLAAQEEQDKAAQALRKEMNTTSRRSSTTHQEAEVEDQTAKKRSSRRRSSRREALDAKLNEHKSSLTDEKSERNLMSSFTSMNSANSRDIRKEKLDAKLEAKIEEKRRRSSMLSNCSASDKLQAKLDARRRSSVLDNETVASAEISLDEKVANRKKLGKSVSSVGSASVGSSSLEEKLARKKKSGSSASEDDIFAISERNKQRRAKRKEKEKKTSRNSSFTPAPPTPETHEQSWDALDDILRQAQAMSLEETKR